MLQIYKSLDEIFELLAKFIMPVLLEIPNGNELKLCLRFKYFKLKIKVVLALLAFVSLQMTYFNSCL